MSSALKNFTITFAVAIVIFMLLGFWAAPYLESAFDFSGMGSREESVDESSDISDESSDTSTDVSTPAVNPEFDENGDVFTLAVMCVDNDGLPLRIAVINANGKTKQYTYCTIDTDLEIENEIGNRVAMKNLFRGMNPDEIAQYLSANTGLNLQYCLVFDRASLSAVAASIPRASITLGMSYTVNNPKYKDQVLDPALPLPEDYTVTIANGDDGSVRLNDVVFEKTNLEWLLEYTNLLDGSEYTILYENICVELLKQYLTVGSNSMAEVLAACKTNLNVNVADRHLEALFAYDEWNLNEYRYPRKNGNVADWEKAINDLRNLDGSYNLSN